MLLDDDEGGADPDSVLVLAGDNEAERIGEGVCVCEKERGADLDGAMVRVLAAETEGKALGEMQACRDARPVSAEPVPTGHGVQALRPEAFE